MKKETKERVRVFYMLPTSIVFTGLFIWFSPIDVIPERRWVLVLAIFLSFSLFINELVPAKGGKNKTKWTKTKK